MLRITKFHKIERETFVGYRKDLKQKFIHPTGTSIFPNEKLTLKDAIFDLQETALPSLEKIARMVNIVRLKIMNTCLVIFPLSICLEIEFDPDEQSFTIQAGGRHAPIHPQAPKMVHVEKNKKIFKVGSEKLYRRMSVRECARGSNLS